MTIKQSAATPASDARIEEARAAYSSCKRNLQRAVDALEASAESSLSTTDLMRVINAFHRAYVQVNELERDLEKRDTKPTDEAQAGVFDLAAARSEILERLARFKAKGGG